MPNVAHSLHQYGADNASAAQYWSQKGNNFSHQTFTNVDVCHGI